MILDILTAFNDTRKNGDDCIYNGYLEDYLHYLEGSEEQIHDLFQSVVELYPNARVVAGLQFAINKDVVSNQIIGYKDAFKLEGRALNCPFLIYVARENEERLFVVTRNKKASYLFAKSIYFCLTEPASIFEKYKNSIITLDSSDTKKTMEAFKDAFSKPISAIQRNVDQNQYTTYDDLRKEAMEVALDIKEKVMDVIRPQGDKTLAIREAVAAWFLLKKLIYVQYMISKSILQNNFQGDRKKQRAQAREYSKEIPFIAYSELWRCSGDNLPAVDEVSDNQLVNVFDESIAEKT